MSGTIPARRFKKTDHAERKGASKRNLEELIEDTLLKNDMGLLDIVCDSATVVGDTAAIWSKGILKILSARVDKEHIQVFLKRALRNRIMDYRARSRDLSDITRDNSLVAMLLTAYARNEGEAYLVQTLTKPLNFIYPILSKCEIDPQKIAKTLATNTENPDSEKEISDNRNNLEHVCEKIFQSIFASQEKLPQTLTSMCCFLTETIEEIKLIDVSTIPRRRTDDSFSATKNPLTGSPILTHDGRASTSIFKGGSILSAPQRSSSFSSKLGSLLIHKKKKTDDGTSSRENVSAVTNGIAPQISTGGPVPAAAQIFSKNPVGVNTPATSDLKGKISEEISIPSTGLKKSSELAAPGSHSEAVAEKSLLISSEVIIPVRQKHAVISRLRESAVTNESAESETKEFEEGLLAIIVSNESLSASPKLHETIKVFSDDALQDESKKYSIDKIDLKSAENVLQQNRSKTSKVSRTESTRLRASKDSSKGSNNLGTLAMTEKIIGSFLFLRFIVPGITSPDINGIMTEKITPSVRRGLILCGKMLTALCNDTEFGYKETSLMPSNSFLEKYRSQMKEFLYKSAQSPVSNSEQEILKSPQEQFKKHGLISKSDFELSESSLKQSKSIPVDLLNRSASQNHLYDVPKQHSDSLKNKEALQPFQQLLKSKVSGSDTEIKARVDADIQAFYYSLGNSLDRIEKDIGSRKHLLSAHAFLCLVQSYSELRIYLNTSGYIEESGHNFKARKSWWVKMMSFLGGNH